MAQSVSIRRFHWIAAAFSGFCLIGGALSLAGWTTSIAWLADWFAAGRATGPFSATAAMLSAVAVICLIARQHAVAMVLGMLTVATGMVALFTATRSAAAWL